MKRRLLAMLMCAVLMIGILPVAALATESVDLDVAVFWYDYNDLFLSYVREALDEELEAAGVEWTNYDADKTQATQNKQINTAIRQGADVLVVNIVDTAAVDAAQAIVDKAAAADLPVIFFNREVDDTVIDSYENACFVGTEKGQAGGMQGKIAADYILENYDDVDLNDDGQISYIMMKGELGNPEADARTRYAVEFCNNALIEAEKPQLVYYDEHNYDCFQPSNWSRTQAFDLMETALSTNPFDSNKPIEVVFANNDDAALGCIEALNNVGYNTGDGKSIPVFGIDCVEDAMAAMEAGKMTGSVLQSADGMAETVAALVNNVVNGENVFANANENFVVDADGIAKIRVPYAMVLEGEPYETDFDYDYEYDYGYEYVDCDVAVFWYDFADAYLATVREALDEELWSMGASSTNYDAARSQATQNDQIDTAIAQGADVLVVNIVDTADEGAAQAIVDKAKAAEIPVIFFNREVSDEVINSYENACFVGVRAAEAGDKQGIMAGQYLVENYDAVDLNGDGKISYIMMMGEVENPEAKVRTRYAVEYCNNVLVEAEKPELVYYDANNTNRYQETNWSRDEAYEQMTAALTSNPMDGEEAIELVFANSDEVALGCIEALNEVDWNTGEGNSIPVYGIDFTAEAADAIEDGRMTGTVYQSARGMAETVAALVNNVANDENVFANANENFNVDEAAPKIRVPYEMITIDNLDEFEDIFGGWYDDFEGASGECGDNLTWVLDPNGVLTIYGEGAMWDYYEDWPTWDEYGYYINRVVIEEGVTHIGSYAFMGYEVSDVYIPSTVTSIGEMAFTETFIFNGIWVAEENEYYSNDDLGILYNGDMTELIHVHDGVYGTFCVPETVEVIKDYALYGGWNVYRLVFMSDAPEFEEAALYGFGAAIFYPENNPTWTEDVMQSVENYATWLPFDPKEPDLTIYGDCGDDLTWAFDEEGTLTISGEGEMWSFEEEHPAWIVYSGGIANVVIEDGVITIGAYAFEHQNFENVTIPASVERIAPSAFAGCYIYNGIWVDEDNQNYCNDEYGVLFEEDLEVLMKAPWGIYDEYIVPEGVVAIEAGAFDGCDFEGVVLPESLEVISEGAFSGCWNFTTISIPANVNIIGNYAFSGCGIEEYTVDKENKFYSNDEYGVLFNKEKTELIIAPWTLEGTYVVPEGVEVIGGNAFAMGYNLYEIELPRTLSYIAAEAFSGCYSVSEMTLPENVRFVGDWAFCDGLYELTVKGDNTTFSEYAFNNCWELQRIVFEGNAPKIFGFEFYWPNTIIFYPEGNETWTEEFMDAYYGATFMSYDPENPDFSIRGESGDNLTWNLSEDGVLTISGEGNMWDFDYNEAPWSGFNEMVYSVVIEDGVTSIGYNTFNPCYNLESVYIPNTVTLINHGAFQDCVALTEINIPASVTEIAHSAFNYCVEMTGIWVDEENLNYSSDENGVLFNKDKTELVKVPCRYEGDFEVATGVETIGDSAFTGCERITSIIIPESVTSISDGAFNNCDILEEIIVDEDNQHYTSDEMGVLFNAEKTNLICVPRTMTGSYTIPDGVVEIGIESFRGCEYITSIYIPASMTNIYSFNLKGCSSLVEVIVDDDNPNYCSENGLMYNKDKTELVFVPDGIMGTIVIPESVTSIDDDAFWYCWRIEEVQFTGDAPRFGGYYIFYYPVAISYPENNPTWTEEVMASFGDEITWIPYSDRLQGDVDGNGEVSNSDLISVARYIVELYDENTIADIEKYGDMNGDGMINNNDLVNIARIIVGLD